MKKLREILDILKLISDAPVIFAGLGIIATGAIAWMDKNSLIASKEVYVSVGTFAAGALTAFVLPTFFSKYRIKCYANKAPRYWTHLKSVIREFHQNQDTDRDKLNRKYQSLRRVLNILCVHYGAEVIQELIRQQPNHPNRPPSAFGNFKMTFYSEKLDDWKKHCQRNLTNELDCFDQYSFFIQKVAHK